MLMIYPPVNGYKTSQPDNLISVEVQILPSGEEVTKERQRAEGSYAEGKNLFSICQYGYKPLNLFMKGKKKCISLWRSDPRIRRPN